MLSSKAAGAMFKYTFSFDDVLLVPKYSDIVSRKEVDITGTLGEHRFELPIISSPMDTVTESEMAISMGTHGGLGIVHRDNTVQEQAEIVSSARYGLQDSAHVGVAVGISGDFLERAAASISEGADVLCVDVAHGHHAMMERCIKTLKDKFPEVTMMAGNVAMSDGYLDLSSWGADAVRVGIGGGSICSTRLQTGHGVPTLQSIFACYIARSMAISNPDTAPEGFTPASIIADGGIRTSGDIVKSIAAGADMVMLGSMLAGTTQAPGEVFVSKDGKKHKAYRGMASRAAQIEWRGRTSSLEGISTMISYKGDVSAVLTDVKQNTKSGFSYTGARTASELRNKCEFVIQTAAGQRESSTHILEKR